jgi:tRNA (guanine-N7-)-methyltransferase
MKRKTRKKNEFLELTNCLNENPNCPGLWNPQQFGRVAPLWVELGAGRCDFSLGLAALYPEHNQLALDVKPERLWAGGKRALERGLHNVRFLRHDIAQLREVFAPREVDKFWITFPDPYPKKKHAKRRMTGPVFLEQYRELLKPNGVACLKTDDPDLFDFTLESLATTPHLEVLEQTRNLHQTPELLTPETRIQTFYEQKWIEERNANIHYVKWRYV